MVSPPPTPAPRVAGPAVRGADSHPSDWPCGGDDDVLDARDDDDAEEDQGGGKEEEEEEQHQEDENESAGEDDDAEQGGGKEEEEEDKEDAAAAAAAGGDDDDDVTAAVEEDDDVQAKIFDTDTEDSNSKRSNPMFILDSGASHHVATDKWLFRRLDYFAAAPESRRNLRQPDGTLLPAVAGTGTVSSENFHLPDVLYIPGLMSGKIIVSVSQLAGLGYDVMFGGGQCRVMDQTGDKLVGQGPLQTDDGLYYRLDFLKILPDDEEAAADGTDG